MRLALTGQSTRDHRRPGISFSMSLPFGGVQCTSVPKAKARTAAGAVAWPERRRGFEMIVNRKTATALGLTGAPIDNAARHRVDGGQLGR